MVFDARKRAERSKRAQEAASSTPQLPDAASPPSDVPNIAPKLTPPASHTAARQHLSSSETADSTLLGLRVERRTNDWRLKWNRNAAVNALRGRLSITDGAVHKQLDLDAHELQTGSIVYTPVTEDVVLRLEVVGSESQAPMSESVRLVVGAKPPLPSQMQVRGMPRGGESRIARSNAAWAKSSESSKRGGAQGAPVVRSLLRVPRSEPASTAPEVAKLSRELAQELAHERAREHGNLEPAILISRRNPVYPAIAKQSLISGSVEVHFRISPQGNVYDVKSVQGSPILAQAAIEAVEEWRYEPARLNGAPIDSRGSTNFDFKLH
jgi:TonB family protein